jgi:hypothetical protein
MTPVSGSSAASAGVDTCVEVDVGDTFQADVFATNLQSLAHFELRIDFDPSILSFDKEAVDFNHFLAKDGGSARFPQVEEEKPGRWFIAAADSSAPDHGTGTLARVTFKALKKGTSSVSIAAQPTVYRPIIEGAQQVFIADDNGDSYWDGQLSNGKAAVGTTCAGATPIVTPVPTTLPTGTPRSGGATTAPSGDAGQPTLDSTGGNDGGADDPASTSSPLVGDVGSDGGSNPTAAPGAQNPGGQGNQGGGGGNGSARGESGGSSGTLMIVLAILGALLAVSSAGLLLWLRRDAGLRY